MKTIPKDKINNIIDSIPPTQLWHYEDSRQVYIDLATSLYCDGYPLNWIQEYLTDIYYATATEVAG